MLKSGSSDSFFDSLFFELLENEEIKIVSFDIFDTLALRDVQKPYQIFDRVGSREKVLEIFESPLAFRNFRIRAEREAREKYCSYDDIKLEWIYDFMPIPDNLKSIVMKYEVEEENKAIFINKQVLKLLLKAYEKGKKIILISDMYLSRAQIEEIVLSKLNDYEDLVADIYVSSEYLCSKKTGKLFKVVSEREQISFSNMVHIGDNYTSDYLKPSSLGIKAILYDVDPYVNEAFELESGIFKKDQGVFCPIRRLSCLSNPYSDSELRMRFFFNFGAYLVGPVLWGFLHWLKKVVYKEKVEQVVFIMREGRIFKKYFKVVAPEINSKLLFVSRRSLLLPLLDVDNFLGDLLGKGKINEFINFDRNTTLEEIYNILGLELPNSFNGIRKLTYFQLLVYKDNFGNPLVKNVLEKLKVHEEKIRKNIKEQRELLKKYLEKVIANRRTLFVDMGGGGSILRGLACILGNEAKRHLYALFYITDRGYNNMLPLRAFSYLHGNGRDKLIKVLRRNCRVLECIFNGIYPTTVKYENNKEKVIPVLENPLKFKLDREAFEELKDSFEALEKGISAFFNTCVSYNIQEICKRGEIEVILERFLDVPLLEEVNFLGGIYYDAGREKLNRLDKLVPKEATEKLVSFVNTRVLYEKLMEEEGKFYWPQGLISLTDSSFLPIMRDLGLCESDKNKKFADFLVNILLKNNMGKVNVYGAGEFFRILELKLLEYNIEIVNLYDSKAYVKPFKIGRYEVKSFEPQSINSYPIVIASVAFADEIFEHVTKILKSIGKNACVVDVKRGISYV